MTKGATVSLTPQMIIKKLKKHAGARDIQTLY
jgi:hypothetical protein